MSGMLMVAIISGWVLFMVIGLMVAMKDHTVFFPKYFETMANFEKDWTQLADEQRSVFQSNADVDVEQLQEIVVVHGRKPIWTVGLRFRFESTCELTCRGSTAGDDDDVRDLERLLELNQNGAGGVLDEEEYQRLKSHLIRKLSHQTASPVATAMAVVVGDDDDNDRQEGYYEKRGLLEMV